MAVLAVPVLELLNALSPTAVLELASQILGHCARAAGESTKQVRPVRSGRIVSFSRISEFIVVPFFFPALDWLWDCRVRKQTKNLAGKVPSA